MRYQASRLDDVDLRDRMKAIAHERRRFGYRRLHVLLRRIHPRWAAGLGISRVVA